MAVYSMTGYASLRKCADHPLSEELSTSGQAGEPGSWFLQLEIRSVNSRFLDLTLKLTEELRPFEGTVRELIQKSVRRGKIELKASLAHSAAGAEDAVPVPPVALLRQLAAAEDAVRQWLPDAARLSVADVMRWCSPSNQDAPAISELHPRLADAITELLHALQQARATEGAQLAAGMLERVGLLRALATQAVPLVPQVVEAQRQRFLERWHDALTQAGASPVSADAMQDRALSEAAAFAMRIDIAEEITRLQAHLDTIEALLRKGGECGKRLEFLIQELHREANTLGSKSAALETARISVDMKVLIEQMREQVQNIE